MVQVVTELLNVDNLAAFDDMSLEIGPTVALNEIITKVKQVDRGNGGLIVRLTWDRLQTFSAKITDKTDIKVKTIEYGDYRYGLRSR